MKNLSKEEVKKLIREKVSELYELVNEIDANTGFEPSLIALVGLDEGDNMNLFGESVIGTPKTLSYMLNMSNHLKKPLAVAQIMEMIEKD